MSLHVSGERDSAIGAILENQKLLEILGLWLAAAWAVDLILALFFSPSAILIAVLHIIFGDDFSGLLLRHAPSNADHGKITHPQIANEEPKESFRYGETISLGCPEAPYRPPTNPLLGFHITDMNCLKLSIEVGRG